MGSLCVVIRNAPYGNIAAAEGVRHLLGGAAAGMPACAVLIDDGVYVARSGQEPAGTGWTSLSEALQQALSPDTRWPSARCRVLVHRPSMLARGIGHLDVIAGVEFADDEELAAVLGSAERLLVF